ncbi:hypothetical protein XANCAGTX0491_003931 [Xanthoria calcicola]
MPFFRPLLSILLCFSIFTQTIISATLPPANKKPPQLWYSHGTTNPPPKSYQAPWYVALSLTNRTHTPSPISGQAVLGTLTAAMYNISLSPPQSPIPDYYNYTLSSPSASAPPSTPSFVATIGVKITNPLYDQPPYQLTYGRLLEALSILGSAYAQQSDMGALVEWGFDVFVLDRLHPNQGRLVAKGAITQPPKPMVRAGGGGGGGAGKGEDE